MSSVHLYLLDIDLNLLGHICSYVFLKIIQDNALCSKSKSYLKDNDKFVRHNELFSLYFLDGLLAMNRQQFGFGLTIWEFSNLNRSLN